MEDLKLKISNLVAVTVTSMNSLGFSEKDKKDFLKALGKEVFADGNLESLAELPLREIEVEHGVTSILISMADRGFNLDEKRLLLQCLAQELAIESELL
ncbi:MAG: hypothetical protein WC682_04915 [Parcubacteria group bacterium]|jgi:hypothetical protein